MDSLRGQLLVSSVRLGDPNFARSVVLVLAHDQNGALGLVLNRPLGLPLHKLSQEILGRDASREGVLHRGGPCESTVLAVFTEDAVTPAAGNAVTAGLRFSGDRDTLEQLLRSPVGEAKFFAGYSGWSAGQLEGELEEEAWLILPARAQHVFASPEQLWELTRTELMLGSHVNPAVIPRDPSSN